MHFKQECISNNNICIQLMIHNYMNQKDVKHKLFFYIIYSYYTNIHVINAHMKLTMIIHFEIIIITAFIGLFKKIHDTLKSNFSRNLE